MIIVTTGFSVSRHFCHDRLVNTGLFIAEPQSCHEIPESCCAGEETSHCSDDIEKDDCCKNENALVKFTEEFTVSQKYNPAAQLFIILSFAPADFQKVLSSAINPDVAKLVVAQPPPPAANLLALIQSFII
jgi:hypothetical protein